MKQKKDIHTYIYTYTARQLSGIISKPKGIPSGEVGYCGESQHLYV